MSDCFDDFEWIKLVSNKEKHCIFGYIRESQQLFSTINPYYNIPSIVSYLTLFYYYQRELTFSTKFKTNNHYQLSHNNKSAKHIEYGAGYILTESDAVYSGTHCWRIQVWSHFYLYF